MLKRLRDVKRYIRPQGQISIEQWEEIESRYSYAKAFLDETNPISLLMREDLQKGKSIIWENRIHEVREERTITDVLKKVFITTKQEQEDELIGQLKYLDSFLKEIQMWIDTKEDLERQEALGKITIERSKEK